MAHCRGLPGPVPVLLPGWEPHNVARADFLDRAPLALHPPHPAVTMSVCPSGWVCHAVRAPGSKVTRAIETRAGSGGAFKGSMRTVPVKYSAGPFPDGCEPARMMSMLLPSSGANSSVKPLPSRAHGSRLLDPARIAPDTRQCQIRLLQVEAPVRATRTIVMHIPPLLRRTPVTAPEQRRMTPPRATISTSGRGIAPGIAPARRQRIELAAATCSDAPSPRHRPQQDRVREAAEDGGANVLDHRAALACDRADHPWQQRQRPFAW